MRFRTALACVALLGAAQACSDAARPAGPEPVTARLNLTGVQGTSTPTSYVSRAGTNKCLNVGSGRYLTVAACSGSASQTFAWQSNGEIRVNGLCLDAYGGRGNNGDPIVAYACHGGANQRWTATTAGEIRGINGKCLDIWGGKAVDGASIKLYGCHGGLNQKWTTSGSTPA